MKLTADISLWGGIDPRTGAIIDTRHPQYGQSIAGKVLAMHRAIGSTSGSSIILELLQRTRGPLGIIVIEADFIVTLGVVVAREMGIPAVFGVAHATRILANGQRISVDGGKGMIVTDSKD